MSSSYFLFPVDKTTNPPTGPNCLVTWFSIIVVSKSSCFTGLFSADDVVVFQSRCGT